ILHYLEQEDYADYFERAKTRASKYFRRNSAGSKRQRKNKCKAHLLQQGFDFGVIDDVLNEDLDPISKDDEKTSLRKLILQSTKRYQRRFEGYELEQKIIQNALSKGYSYGSIKEIMEELNEYED
ncbi:MAG TPA: RecX family transcriptional regulator, partial [Erysipelothrix sp.]|nr:RecX family transcriptional regulator [Erysipelothrix sp.]